MTAIWALLRLPADLIQAITEGIQLGWKYTRTAPPGVTR